MKFIVSVLLSAFLAYVICLFLPWWGFALTSFLVALAIPQKPWKALLAGFLALFLFWAIYAFMLDNANAHLLSKKVAAILPLGGSTIAILFLSAFIGGIISAFAALTGSYVMQKNT
ncbi:MAG: hypothetical protein ACR2FN_02800 [Chitinophagaceae bacterium]